MRAGDHVPAAGDGLFNGASTAADESAGGPGKIYLVGAGPGDPDLITVRGAQLCQSCDALVYDSLVPAELVANSPALRKIYVGKTEGGHTMTQDEITRLLVDLAHEPGGPRRIVRLKGGDPYVFGRGGEEALACREAGVPLEVVPGVTAGVAAPAYAGVPVTHRRTSRGVIFFTGHLAHGNLDHLPWAQLATSGFTLVSYMGVSTLEQIAARLVEAGLAPDTPAMVVQEGTTPGQRSVCAPLSQLAERARAAGIRPPAVTVIGQVVSLAETLGPQRPRPLAGKTVVLLKAEESSYSELAPLRRAGARVIEVSVVRCVQSPHPEEVETGLLAMRGEHVVFFRSAAAARFFGDAWRKLSGRPQPRLIAGSPTVRDALLRQGFDVVYTEQGRVGALETLRGAAVAPGTTVWMPRSTGAGTETPRELEAAGFSPRLLRVYETKHVPVPNDVRSILSSGRVDAVLFLSGSCARAAAVAAPHLGRQQDRPVLFGAVGPLTARAASEVGIHCEVVPDLPRVADLVDAVLTQMIPGSR